MSSSAVPNLEGQWQFTGQRLRYVPLPNGTVIPPNLQEPEDLPFEATIVQNGRFFTVDIPVFTGPPRLGVISGQRCKWSIDIADTNDNGVYTASFSDLKPSKFQLTYREAGFACPRKCPLQPCALAQTPTVLIGELRRVKPKKP